MKSKLAQMGTLVTIIIIVSSSLVIGAWWVTKAAPSIDEKAILEACRSSITALSTANVKSKGFLPSLKINCPAPDKKFKKAEDRLLTAQVATEITNCWYKTAEDKNRLGKNYKLLGDWLSRDSDICVVCSTFTLEKEIETSKIISYLNERVVKTTSHDNEHIFIDIIDGMYNVRIANPRLFSAYVGMEYGFPVTIYKQLDSLYRLDKDKTYYVISAHAAYSTEKDDFNNILVLSEDDLRGIKCDAYYHQKI